VEAAWERPNKLKFAEILAQAAGAWGDEKHPDLATQDDINRYLHRVRQTTEKRLQAQ
jgi:hypothetical protein